MLEAENDGSNPRGPPDSRRFNCGTSVEDVMPDLKVGDPAPDFTLQDSNGQTVRLADLRGKKVLLYFFTSPGDGN